MDSKMNRRTALVGLSGAFLAACGGGTLYGPPAGSQGSPVSNAPQPPIRPPGHAAVPLYWSDMATNALLDEYAIAYEFVGPVWGPADDTRTLAMMFIAGHDALNATRRLYAPYLFSPVPDPSADPDLAYATAACRVLQARMPWRPEFGVAYRAMLDSVSDGLAKTRAVEIGEASAQAILADRANDGADQAWGGTYVAGPAPGDYRPTPPYYKAKFVNWGQVRPFALTAGSQFRAPSPYAVTDPAYATDFAEVKLKGDANGSARSMNERETADIFWSQTVPLGWQQIARELVRYSYTDSGPDGRWAGARIFALLQIALADAYITALDSKYHHRFWRPITAIGLADSDGNPDTIADVAWQPYHPETPPVPEYPSASALAATAAATALAAVVPPYFDTIVYADPWFPARTREYPETGDGLRGFGAIADDTGLSQILFGHNFRRSVEVGWELGASVGRWAVEHRLSALPV